MFPGEDAGGSAVGETMEEAGRLEADVGARFDRQLSNMDPRLEGGSDPAARRPLRPEIMQIRGELRQAKLQTLAVRRDALRHLLLRDMVLEDCQLRNLGLAYTPAV